MLPRADRFSARTLVVVLAVLAFAWPASAQQPAGGAPAAVTEADYARAEKFLAPAVNPLVVGGTVTPSWLPGDRFTYTSTTADGVQFLLVDPVKRTKAVSGLGRGGHGVRWRV